MAYISKIKLPNDTIYDVKDASVPEQLETKQDKIEGAVDGNIAIFSDGGTVDSGLGIDEVDALDITTSISSESGDDEIPTAKAVQTRVENMSDDFLGKEGMQILISDESETAMLGIGGDGSNIEASKILAYTMGEGAESMNGIMMQSTAGMVDISANNGVAGTPNEPYIMLGGSDSVGIYGGNSVEPSKATFGPQNAGLNITQYGVNYGEHPVTSSSGTIDRGATWNNIFKGATSLQPGDDISELNNDEGFIGDAPSDSKQYARKNGAWEEVQGGSGSVSWGSIMGALSNQRDLQDILDSKVVKFEATYGSTAWSNIQAALNHNEFPMCVYDNRLYLYAGVASTYVHYFATIVDDTYYWLSVSPSKTWSNGSTKIGTFYVATCDTTSANDIIEAVQQGKMPICDYQSIGSEKRRYYLTHYNENDNQCEFSTFYDGGEYDYIKVDFNQWRHYSTLIANDINVVHKTEEETISGQKTFSPNHGMTLFTSSNTSYSPHICLQNDAISSLSLNAKRAFLTLHSDASLTLGIGNNEDNIVMTSTETKINKYCPFPVNSIYMSMDSANPSTIWTGTTWQRISQGRVLVGVDENDTSFVDGATGGSKYLQAHTHTYTDTTYKLGTSSWKDGTQGTAHNYGTKITATANTNTSSAPNVTTGSAGNLQPYMTCYIWQRLS